MADFRFVKTLWGNTPDLYTGTADEALEAGDLCNFDGDGELEKLDNNAAESDIVLVLEDAVVDQTGVQYMWVDPGVIIEGTMVGTLGKVGDLVGIDDTAGVLSFEAAAGSVPAKFQIREIVDVATKTIRAVRIYTEST